MHIGFAKAGSSFLQRWFEQHPQLQYSSSAIAGFTSVYDIARMAHHESEELPRYYVTSKEILSVPWQETHRSNPLSFMDEYDLSADHMGQKQARACEILYQLFPGGRILIVTRGHKSILRSSYSEYVKLGGVSTFHQYLESSRPVLNQWLDIDHLVKLYSTVFGESNVILMPYELLKNDPTGFLVLLENELELDHQNASTDHINPSLSPWELYCYAAISRRVLTPLAKRLSDRAAARLHNTYGRRLVRPSRLGRLIRMLERFRNNEWTLNDFPAGYLDAFQDKAMVLREKPLYADYLADYLVAE